MAGPAVGQHNIQVLLAGVGLAAGICLHSVAGPAVGQHNIQVLLAGAGLAVGTHSHSMDGMVTVAGLDMVQVLVAEVQVLVARIGLAAGRHSHKILDVKSHFFLNI